MTRQPPVLLLTRPAAQADRFAAAARARFGPALRIVISPLMAPDLLSPDLPREGLAGLVFTSETGVAGLVRLWPGCRLPAHCVGAGTAAAARAAGLAVATEGPGDGTGLVADLVAARVDGPLLWPRGQEAAVDIAAALTAAGIETRAAVVYRQVPAAPTDAALAVLGGPVPVLLPLFSPRSARLAAAALVPRRAPIWVAAISPAVADAAAGLAPGRLAVAARPGAAPMLDALADLIAAAPPA